MPHMIACRLSAYGPHQDRAWTHLPEIGIHCIEMHVPPHDQWKAIRRRLAGHGLRATSLQGRCDLQQPNIAEQMRPQFEACAYLGTSICLLALGGGGLDQATLRDRLRRIGDEASRFDITVVLETHPDLVTSGDEGRRTMQLVDHPAIRINFDTANVYFYNAGVTALTELEKLLPWTAAVHLKDTTGAVGDWYYPALGNGVVDFPAVFRMLDASGFTGPCTLELEGSKASVRAEQAQLAHIAAAADYLRHIGA